MLFLTCLHDIYPIFLFRHSSRRNLVRHQQPGVVIKLVQLYDVAFFSSFCGYCLLIF